MRDAGWIDLFERYRSQGDVSALARLFDEVGTSLLKVARHLDSRRGEAEDLVQTTFLVAIERSSTYDATRPLMPWLMGILVNQSRIARRRRKEIPDGAEHESPSASTQHEDLEASELAKAVTQALAELPETYRQVLVAHLQEGKKPRDIARELGRPQGTVRAQLHRGLRLMRDILPASFSLGFLALLAPHSLAGVRRNVLLEAHRRAIGGPLPVSSAPKRARPLAAQSVVVGLLMLVAGVAAWSWAVADEGDAEVAVRGAVAHTDESSAVLEEPGEASELSPRTQVRRFPSPPPASADHALDTGTVIVRVERLGNRAPVEGALVSLIPWGSERWFDQLVEGRTGRDGTATFAAIHPGRTGIHIDRGEQSRVEVVAGDTLEFLAIIHDAIELVGDVVDETDAPVAGAEVFVCCPDGTRLDRPSARTDGRGRFTLRDVDPEYTVAAIAPGFAPSGLVRVSTPTLSEAAKRAPRIRLQSSGRSITGRILGADGLAVGAARIRAAPPRTGRVLWHADGSSEIEPGPHATTSALDGAFAFRDLPDGLLSIRIEAEGWAPWSGTVERGAGERLDVRLARGALLVGTVVLSSDQVSPASPACVGALVSIDDGTFEARCDARGRFELLLPAGEHVVRAQSGRFARPTEERIVLLEGERHTWHARVEPAAIIRGVATTLDGAPLRRGLVRCFPEVAHGAVPRADAGPWTDPAGDLDDLVQSWTDDQGGFVVPAMAGALHVLEVRKRLHWLGPAAGRVEGVPAGSDGIVVRISGRDAWFDGSLAGSDGRPIDGGKLFALPESATASYHVDVDPATGRFHLGPLLGGAYRLRLCAPGRAPIDLGGFQLPKNSTHDLGRILLPEFGSAEVRGEGPFVLVSPGGLWLAPAPRGDDAWTADGLTPGAYTVHRGARAVGPKLIVKPGERARLDVQR